MVTRQEHLELVATVGPLVPDHPDVRGVIGVVPDPVTEQVVNDGVEPFYGRIPGLEQVVVELDVVDRR